MEECLGLRRQKYIRAKCHNERKKEIEAKYSTIWWIEVKNTGYLFFQLFHRFLISQNKTLRKKNKTKQNPGTSSSASRQIDIWHLTLKFLFNHVLVPGWNVSYDALLCICIPKIINLCNNNNHLKIFIHCHLWNISTCITSCYPHNNPGNGLERSRFPSCHFPSEKRRSRKSEHLNHILAPKTSTLFLWLQTPFFFFF